jgi:hypothetical protein
MGRNENMTKELQKPETFVTQMVMDILARIDSGSLDHTTFLSETYARVVCAEILGYSTDGMQTDAKMAAKELSDIAYEKEPKDF